MKRAAHPKLRKKSVVVEGLVRPWVQLVSRFTLNGEEEGGRGGFNVKYDLLGALIED